jgi:hypothetical protein
VVAKKAAVATAAQQRLLAKLPQRRSVKPQHPRLPAAALTTWTTTFHFEEWMIRLAPLADANEQPVDLRSTGFYVIGLPVI